MIDFDEDDRRELPKLTPHVGDLVELSENHQRARAASEWLDQKTEIIKKRAQQLLWVVAVLIALEGTGVWKWSKELLVIVSSAFK